MTKDEIQMVRHGLLDSEWCGFSKIKTVHALCDLALKGLTIAPPEALSAMDAAPKDGTPILGWVPSYYQGYCRFQNTVPDLEDCYDFWDEGELSPEEEKARKRLLKVCENIVAEYGNSDE